TAALLTLTLRRSLRLLSGFGAVGLGEGKLLRGGISGLRCSPYPSTAALLTLTLRRSLRLLSGFGAVRWGRGKPLC
ncbi:hypothetical protein QN374_16745, partial [Herbaspirillum sp. RTI4]|uniref:hypothetical protein n=1 Tax=Herbaspirillum sp. RTI4 TaxID=3048640 RepID=UPI002B23E781